VKLLELGGDRAIETAAVVPPADYGMVSFDLRKHNLDQAEALIEYFEGNRRVSVARVFLAAQSVEPLSPGRRIPVMLDVPAQVDELSAWPITFGIPFPAGKLWSTAELRMVDRDGHEIACQKEITGLWAREGSIKWVRFDALVEPAVGCFVEFAPPLTEASTKVKARQDGDNVVLDTGVSRYVLSKELSPIEEIWLGKNRLASSAGTRGLYVVDQKGRRASASARGARVDIEAIGPVAASVRVEGFYRTPHGDALARHITRVEVFAGQPFANVTHTLVLTNDTNEVWFKEIGWEFAVEPGKDERGIFSISREDAAKTAVVKLTGDSFAYALQDEHVRFGGGGNHFVLVQDGKMLVEGEECGDWASLAGARGGLMLACKETARQHPKEFELSRDRFVFRLFSDRSGEELDFRAPTLARKWNLPQKTVEKLSGFPSNAMGWSKTHELRLSPLTAGDGEEESAQLAALHSAPVYACAAPKWIGESGAMGFPFHPRDPERFPEAEKMVDWLFEAWAPRGHSTGHYGFCDYYAGPTYGTNSNQGKRYKNTYALRSSIWLVYARSGDRAVREFAEGTNKAYLDNYIAHWDVPGKERGLFCEHGSGAYFMEQFPFYWGNTTRVTMSSSTNLNQFIWLYQLTGYRRAKDAIVEFGEGLKRIWKPGLAPRVIMVMRELAQCYGLTWDPALRAMAERVFDDFSDPEAELLLTKNRPYGSTTYKTSTDLRGLVEVRQLLGHPKYHETARRVSRFWWNYMVGTQPVKYMSPWGFVGAFLYDDSHDPRLPAALDFNLRRLASTRFGVGASQVAAVFEGIPYALRVIALQTPESAVPWVAYRDYRTPASVVINKGREDSVDLTIRTSDEKPLHFPLGHRVTLRPLDIVDWAGGDLYRTVTRSYGATEVRIPKDAPPGNYEVAPEVHGESFVLASKPTQMVLHSPGYWMLPDLAPALRIYFKLPPESEDAQIFLEGKARLFDPGNQAFGETTGVKGWVDLPDDRPGLWSFEPLENRLVRGRNFPPFFAFGNAKFYFEPPIKWQREEPERSLESVVRDTGFVSADIEDKDNQALYLGGGDALSFPAGPPHGSGEGGQFLPYSRGTVEFFFKPSWSTFNLGDGDVQVNFVQILTDGKSNWSLLYRLHPNGVNINLCPKDPTHSLFGSMYLNDKGKSWLRLWHTETLFDRDKWTHIAFVWGPERSLVLHRKKANLMTMRIFVDGEGSKWTIFPQAGEALPHGTPQELVLGPLNGAVDQLRVADIQRYKGDFSPPDRERELRADQHTRALFHFNGNLKGQSHGNGELAGVLRKQKK